MIRKILIANRGEIACRIIRTARSMGIKTVALYSEIDAFSKHVQLADEAYLVGGPQAKESYLNISKIIEVLKTSRADAVHPGYGFLSENAEFAQQVIQAGAIFIGPSPQVIKDMGDKLRAKEIARQAGIPLIPRTEFPIFTAEEVLEFAREYGYPLLLKAAAGGGGKGMRILYSDAEIKEALERTKSESFSSFGDDRIFIEKYIEHPRHIEVQILGDQHGNILHFGERDCSLQRRHQKVVEETPAPCLSDSLRKEIIESALKIAKSMSYYSAGTVEFVVAPDNKFYFLEVNTRLQVEHPVTEMVYGIDLVELMIRVAVGEKLRLDLNKQPKGHAIEIRLYAEDADNHFLPSCGKLTVYHPPAVTENLRIDSSIREGDDISIYYDPMIAKVIAYGGDREEALTTLNTALSNFIVEGVDTNLNYLQRLLEDEEVKVGTFHTGLIAEKANFLKAHYSALENDSTLKEVIGAISLSIRLEAEPVLQGVEEWIFILNDKETKIRILEPQLYQIDSKILVISFEWTHQRSLFKISINNKVYTGKAAYKTGVCRFTLLGREYSVPVEREAIGRLLKHLPQKNIGSSLNTVYTPMPGILLSLQIAIGDKVQTGQPIAIIEAMKMENTLKSPADGTIVDISVIVGDKLAKGQVIAKLKI